MTDAHAAAETLTARFEAAWNAHDMVAFADLFHPDATFVNRLGMYWRGRERIEAEHAGIHATIYSDSTLANTLEDVDPLTHDVAVVHMLSVLTAGPAMPHGPRVAETRMLMVITREQGTWRIKAGENVTVAPPRSPPGAGT